jgi:hypothetical protein
MDSLPILMERKYYAKPGRARIQFAWGKKLAKFS